MKAARTQATFVPIVLTIETKEEADHLYNILNLSTSTVKKLYEEKGIPCPLALDSELTRYYRILSEVYRP